MLISYVEFVTHFPIYMYMYNAPTHAHTYAQEIAEYWEGDNGALDAVLCQFVTRSYVQFVTHSTV